MYIELTLIALGVFLTGLLPANKSSNCVCSTTLNRKDLGRENSLTKSLPETQLKVILVAWSTELLLVFVFLSCCFFTSAFIENFKIELLKF